jgi:DNA invertase Pin-like site-specific DNA recombinase
MPRAAIYARLSQDRDGTSTATDRQVKDCKALCKREGLTVVETFVDNDVSAYNGAHRPGFAGLMEGVRRRDFDVLVYWKTDRLVRRFHDLGGVMETCDQAGVRLVSVVDPIDTSTAMGKGIAGMMAAMAETESANISLRVKRRHEEAALRGDSHGHRRAYGYSPDGNKVVAREAKHIRDARDRIFRGESMRAICADWNERGVQTAEGKAWRVHGFKKIMTSARIAGLREYQGEVVAEGIWPAIVTPEERDRIIAIVGDPKVRKRGRPVTYLLSGMTTCGRCGAVLRAGNKDGKRRWSCLRVPGDDHHCAWSQSRSSSWPPSCTGSTPPRSGGCSGRRSPPRRRRRPRQRSPTLTARSSSWASTTTRG